MKFLKLNFIFFMIVFIFVNNSFSKGRKAFIIGNGDYSFSPLRYSVSDAENMKKTLKDLNFEIIFLKNGSKADILKKLKVFKSKISKDDTLLFYYSGHGIQMGNEIYIVPVEASFDDEIDAECQSVRFSRVLRHIVKAGSKSNIFILDSCRENPFAGNFRTVTRGFSGVSSKGISNTIISYSTGEGNFAVDKNSYTETLLKYIKIPGIKIEDVFKKTAKDVMDRTGGKQIPWQATAGFYTDFYPGGKLEAKERYFTQNTGKNGFKKNIKKEFTNLVGMKFVWIKPGTFKMGSPESEPGRFNNENLHMVKLTRGFYMQTTEVTQGQYKAVMGENPSDFNECGDNCPVENVSWYMAYEFIKKLNKVQDKYIYSLPTEAQWEYCARAGTRSPFAFGDCLSTEHANYDGNYPLKGCIKGEYRKKIIPAGSLKANSWGLYDMHGNVREWCKDWHGKYPTGIVKDPAGAKSDSNRVNRGGSWFVSAWYCRSAYRDFDSPGDAFNFLVFRVVASQADR